MSIQPNSDALQPYLDADWQLIPLHRWDKISVVKGKDVLRGKSPISMDWPKRPYKSEDQLSHMDLGSNVGVRLGPDQVVLDVDPRNFEKGDDPYRRLCEDCGIVPSEYPTVHTGSGGLHLYMTKDPDISVRDSIPAYVGLEYKTIGRQVVSAGSIHPESKSEYEWDFLCPDLEDAPPAPTLLINVIRRPDAQSSSNGGGEYSQEELAEMLEHLDPEDFKDQGEWFTLMQSCHHATCGDGRSEFVSWSTQDPEYRNDGGLIGRRWDSLHADSGEGVARVTFRTLDECLRKAGKEDKIPRKAAEDDFEPVGPQDISEEVGLEAHEKKGPLERMNDRYWAVMENSLFKVYWEEKDREFMAFDGQARTKWVKAKVHDFKHMMSNQKVQKGKTTVPIAQAWLEWGGRRSADSVIFDPERNHKGCLNLWTGWSVQPEKGGSWQRLNELLYEVLCDGDQAVYDYVLNWAAYLAQKPGSPAEVAICFQGGKGVGKGTWGRVLADLAGKHGMHITSSEQLTGRFNGHLRDLIVLFADEAIKPYDKDGESRLKGLITEPTLTYEGKGLDPISGRNRLHVVMASNEDWFIPAGLEAERRFLLQKSNQKRQGQHSWFAKLHRELKKGGYKALLWDLLNRNIDGWAPRQDIPGTKAIVEQKIRNLDPIQQWWFGILQEGSFPSDSVEKDETGFTNPKVPKADMRANYLEFCKENGIKPGGNGRGIDILFGKSLKKLVPGLKDRIKIACPDDRIDIKPLSDGRIWAYEVPEMPECRAAFEAILGSKINWE